MSVMLIEEQDRYAIFASNMEKARKLQRTERGSAMYGATSMADLTGVVKLYVTCTYMCLPPYKLMCYGQTC